MCVASVNERANEQQQQQQQQYQQQQKVEETTAEEQLKTRYTLKADAQT